MRNSDEFTYGFYFCYSPADFTPDFQLCSQIEINDWLYDLEHRLVLKSPKYYGVGLYRIYRRLPDKSNHTGADDAS